MEAVHVDVNALQYVYLGMLELFMANKLNLLPLTYQA